MRKKSQNVRAKRTVKWEPEQDSERRGKTKDRRGGRRSSLVYWVRKASVSRIACLLLVLFEWFERRAYPSGSQSIVPFHDLSTDSSEKGRRKWRGFGKVDVVYGPSCCRVGFSGVLLPGVSRTEYWTKTRKIRFLAAVISSPFRAIVPNLCLLSTISRKEEERQRGGNGHRPSLAA